MDLPGQLPTDPTITSTIPRVNPMVSTINGNIPKGRRINVTGSVIFDVPTIEITSSDVHLDFTGADEVVWTSSSSILSFFDISGASRRILIEGFRAQCSQGQRRRGFELGLGLGETDVPEDIHIRNCELDGAFWAINGDAKRLWVDSCDFTNLNRDAANDGEGVGIYLGNFSEENEDILISESIIQLAPNAEQRPVRMLEPLRLRFIDTILVASGDPNDPGNTGKNACWIYGGRQMQFTRCTFVGGHGVWLGLPRPPSDVDFTDIPTEGVRLFDCDFQDTLAEAGLIISCGVGGRDIRMRYLRGENLAGDDRLLLVNWRDNGVGQGDISEDINWYIDTMCVDGEPFEPSYPLPDPDWEDPDSVNISECPG